MWVSTRTTCTYYATIKQLQSPRCNYLSAYWCYRVGLSEIGAVSIDFTTVHLGRCNELMEHVLAASPEDLRSLCIMDTPHTTCGRRDRTIDAHTKHGLIASVSDSIVLVNPHAPPGVAGRRRGDQTCRFQPLSAARRRKNTVL